MLNSKFKTLIGVAIAMLALVVVIGCGSDDSTGKNGPVDKLIDTASAKIADKVVEAAFAKTGPNQFTDTSRSEVVANNGSFDNDSFTDILLTDDKLYALFDGGLVVHDRASGDNVIVHTDDPLTAIVKHQGEIYVGGKYLYTLNQYSLDRQEGEFEGVINALYSYDHLLMIGTATTLYSESVFGLEKLADNVAVTALAADRDGLWIGTAGDGLYRWDGNKRKERYLLRDTTLFDYVNTLDFKHDHLYVGTPNGLHIFDGGRWQNLSTDDGLPSNNVTSIDASDWTVYVGTDNGVVSFFENELKPVERLEHVKVAQIVRSRQKSYVASVGDGVLVNTRSVKKELIAPIDPQATATLTYAQ